MKRLLIGLLVAVVVLGGGALLLRQYLRSAHVASQVATRLEAMYGGPVRVESVDVGIESSSVSGFELFEPGSDAESSTPWLKVGALTTDVSLWNLLKGQAQPTQIKLSTAKVLLRFDADGRLLTQFPSRSGAPGQPGGPLAFPEISLDDGEVVLRKDGQPELVVRKVTAQLRRDPGGSLLLSGTGESAEIGKLVLSGSVELESRHASATLRTEQAVYVTQSLLDRLPFVPAITWQEVQVAEGRARPALTVRYDLETDAMHYRLDAAPEQVSLRVPALDLAAHDGSGKLTVEDGLVKLRDVRGKAYGGEIEGDADLDFRGPESLLNFPRIKVRDVKVAEVPKTWNVPAVVRTTLADGKLTGTASLDVTIGNCPVAPAAAGELAGLIASVDALPALSALAALPHRDIRTRSEGKAIVKDVAGGTAEIELKLAPHGSRPASPAPRSSLAPTAGPLLFAALAVAATMQVGGDTHAYPDLNIQLGRSASELVGGVNAILRATVRFGSRFMDTTPRKAGPPSLATPETAENYLDLNLKLKNVDLGKLVQSLGVKLDFPVEGKVSFQVKASIPTDKTGDLKAYRLQGKAQVADLLFAGVHIHEADADIRYKDGELELSALSGRFSEPERQARDDRSPRSAPGLGPGTFRGNGKLQVAPLGELSAQLALDRIPLSEVAGLAPGKLPLGGSVSGQLAVRAPSKQLKNLAAIEGSGKLRADRITVAGLMLEDASTSLQLHGGRLRLPELRGKLEGTPVSATAELHLADAYPFKAQLDLKNWDLSALQKLAAPGKESPIKLAGAFTTTVDLDGTLRPFKVNAAGDAATEGLKVNTFQVAAVKFHWATDGRKLDLAGLDLRLYGGQASGSAVLPLQADAAGKVDLKLAKLDARQLVKDLAVPLKIEGQVDGRLTGTMPPAQDGKPRIATMDLDISAPKLRVQNIPTEQLRGKLDYQGGVIDYRLEGKSLGGTFELDGQIPRPVPVKQESRKGGLRIENVTVGRLVESLQLQDVLPLTGRLSVELDYTHDTPDRGPQGKGRVRLTNLRWHGTALATTLQGELLLSDGLLRLRELSGEIAQGLVRVQFAYNLRDPRRSHFNVTLENVEASQLLATWLDEKIKGPLQARIRGSLGESWQGTADLELSRGEVYGLEVTQWRLPLHWQYSPETRRAQIEVYETTAQVARGRAQAKLNATLDSTLRLEGQVRFSGVDLQTLVRPFVGATQVAGGQITGRFDFSGSEVRSINDLNGTLAASFSQTQALQLPVLQQVAPFIGMGQSTTFQRGDLRARLDRGVLRIQQLALTGGNLQLHVDGTMSLEGRLNLNVIAKTGDVGLPTLRLGAIGVRIPVAGPVPLVLLQEASALLANRVIYLEVTGTVRNPVIRVRPLQMLSEEAVRFFLNRANLPIPLAP
jgi:uncharacterized protein involved in outer membrane biogenesis